MHHCLVPGPVVAIVRDVRYPASVARSVDTFTFDAGHTTDGDEALVTPVGGRRIGDFELVELIGRGSYAAVWRARQRGLAREVAVKVLHERLSAHSTIGARFAREADLASRLDHPHAAHVYAVGMEEDGTRWIAMELVRGVSLARLLELRGPLELPAFTAMMERLGEVVQAAHELGLVHRDIKPANVVVRSVAGRLLPKLMDFGLARTVADVGDVVAPGGAAQFDATLTGHGAIVGSPAFMAPEQWRDAAAVGPAADQYALAVLGWQLLTGTLPYQASQLTELARLHQEAPVPSLGPAFPPALDAAMRQALAKDAAERWPDVAAFVKALREATRPAAMSEEVPALEPVLRERVVRAWPTPIAEAVARLSETSTPSAAATALRLCARVTLRWIGLLALACRPVLRRMEVAAGDDTVLARLTQGRLPDNGWADLVREQLAPWAGHAEACPLPELPGLVLGDLPERLAALAAFGEEELGAGIERLGAALEALRFVEDARLVSVSSAGTRAWVGARRRVGAAGEPGAAAATWVGLEDQDGALILRLSPFVDVAAPGPGAPLELFLFEGPGRAGSNAIAWPAGYERVLRSIDEDAELAFSTASQSSLLPADEERAPWPGLDAWAEADARRFVGRERELEAVLNRLRDAAFVAIVGPSGTGKSSLLRAGLLPALPEGWHAALLRPGRHPLAALAAALDRPGLDARLRSDPRALAAALGEGHVTVLAVDQLEELVTLAEPEEAEVFARALAASGNAHLRIVATLRDDFLMRVGAVGGLAAALSAATFILETPDRISLARILSEPLRQRGYALEERDLPTRVAEELKGRPAALALLSFAGVRLWEHRDRARRIIPAGVYARLGGVAGMVAHHAEGTWGAMPPAAQDATRLLFGRLFTSAGTRARVSRATLLAAAPDAEAAAQALDQLLRARLVVADEDAGVEVAHEALLGVWPRLAAWREELGAAARFREQLSDAARQWVERGRAPGLLWRGDALAELRVWRRRGLERLGGDDAAFAEACELDARREGRARLRLQVLLVALLVLVILALSTLYQRAETARADATEQARLAKEQLVDVYLERGRASVESDPWRALVYFGEGMRDGRDDPEIRALLGAAFSRIPPFRRLGPPSLRVRGPSIEPNGVDVAFHTEADENWRWTPDGAFTAAAGGAPYAPCGGALFGDPMRNPLVLTDAAGVERLSVAERVRDRLCAGQDLFVNLENGTMRLYDGATGALRWEKVRTEPRSRNNGGWGAGLLLTGDTDGHNRLFRFTTGDAVDVPGPPGMVPSGQLAPNARTAAVWGGARSGVTIVDAADGSVLFPDAVTCGAGVGAYTPSGDAVFVADIACGLRRVPVDGGAPLVVFPTVERGAQLATLPDGVLLMEGQRWRVLDAGDGGVRADWRVPGSVEVVPSAGHLVWTTADGVVRDTTIEAPMVVPDMPEDPCEFWVGAPDGRRWACIQGQEGAEEARVWDTVRHTWLGSLVRAPTGLGRSVPAFDATGETLVFGGDPAGAQVWRPGAEPKRFPAPAGGEVRVARLSPDGRVLAAGGAGNEVRLHDVSGEALRTVPMPELPFTLAWRPDGRQIAVGLGDGGIALVDPSSATLTRRWSAHGRYTKALTWSADGARLVSGGGDGTVHIWDVATGTATGTAETGFPVLEVAFGPGPFVTLSGFGGPTEVWDPASGTRILGFGPASNSAWLSPDGSTLRYADQGRLLQWTVTPYAGTVPDLLARLRCEVPFGLEHTRVVETPGRCE